ncbi:hypothetical protein [Kitasatospora sp. NPDC051914]|uniref:hypothetical protein n=1 Tax=Kitasatospora sp. NPDC051914 TaxID=3154945 RepID=UPI00343AB21B
MAKTTTCVMQQGDPHPLVTQQSIVRTPPEPARTGSTPREIANPQRGPSCGQPRVGQLIVLIENARLAEAGPARLLGQGGRTAGAAAQLRRGCHIGSTVEGPGS